MTKKNTVKGADAVLPGACLHPLESAFNKEREDGSGKWDRICGVPGCGFVMCEIAPPCAHLPFQRSWVVVEPELAALICECGHDLGKRQPAPGKYPVVKDGDPETEAAVQAAEASFSQAGEVGANSSSFVSEMVELNQQVNQVVDNFHAEPGEVAQSVPAGEGAATSPFSSNANAERVENPCINKDCPDTAANGSGNGCTVLGWDELKDCKNYQPTFTETVEGHTVADSGAETIEVEEQRAVFVPNGQGPASYVTRPPDKVGGRFQVLLPVPVDDGELEKLGMELTRQFDVWSTTKVDAKKYAKGAKEVTDRCEKRMTELKEVLMDKSRLETVDCVMEYDFTEGVKRQRRMDTQEIVETFILTIEERQGSLFDINPEAGVEKLRETQRAAAGENTTSSEEEREQKKEALKELQALLAVLGLDVTQDLLFQQSPEDLQAAQIWADAVNQQAGDFQDNGVPSLPFFLKGLQTAVPAGELVGNGYPLHPDQVGEELQAVQEELTQADPPFTMEALQETVTAMQGRQAEMGLDQETINLRDEFCNGWRNCAELELCMGPENTTGQCYHIVQEQEADRFSGDPLGAALAEED